jgi:PAS domain S-box-containing protein
MEKSRRKVVGLTTFPGRMFFRCALICALAFNTVQPSGAKQTHLSSRALQPPPQQIEVLFLSSLDPDLPDVAAMIEQTETQILTGSDRPVRFSFEYLDFPSALADTARGKAATSYLLDKYRGQTFQLVIAIGEETVMFAEPMQPKLFPDGALVFFAGNPQSTELWIDQQPSITGVIRETNYLPTLQLALRQNPGTSRVIVVAGSSEGEKIDVKIARKQFQPYEGNLKFEYVTDLELAELGPRLASAKSDTVILFLDFVIDSSGEQFIPARILPAISKAAARPIYGTFSSLVGNGALGGSVADLVDVGRVMGQDGARLLKGERAENIPVTTGAFQHYMIDWRQFHRWGISDEQLPPDSVLINWEYSPWELYRWKIFGLFAALLIETLLIVILLRSISRRKKAQESLRRSEAELAEAQRLARVGNWTWDPKTKAFSWSEELYHIHGLASGSPPPSFEELSRLFTPESWERFSTAMQNDLKTGVVQELDLELVRPDGSKGWVTTRGAGITDSHGHATQLRGTTQDITDRKKAEEARSRLAAIVESSDDAIISKDLDGIILSWNVGAEHIFGFTEEEAVGQSITKIVPPDLKEEERMILAKTRAGEKIEHYETARMTKQGERIHVSLTISPMKDATGGVVGASKIARDITERKRVQEDLERSEERFSKVFRHSPTALSLTNAKTQLYLDVNGAFEQLCGYTRAELVGKSAREIGLQMDPSERASLAQQFQTQGFLRNVECAYRARDGRVVIGLTSAELIEIGGESCVLGVIADITDRKEIEEKLKVAQSRMAVIVSSAMDAIVAVDDQQRIVLFNVAAEKMFGCSARSVIGQSIGQFIPDRFRAGHSEHVSRFGQTGVTNRKMGAQGALWAVRPNGEEFPIEASISHVNDGGKKLFTVIIRDVTERRRAEDAAAESEKRFRLIANTAPALIWMSGPDKLCNYFNQPWLEFTGRRLEQELGNRWAERVHPEDLKECFDTYTRHFDRKERFEMEYRLRRHDGEFRWILDVGVPRFNGDGSFAGYVGCCMDITEQKEARRVLVEFSSRLLRAGEEERSRIARELHDDINQRLALLANGLQEAEQKASGKKDSLQQALQELWQLTNAIATDIQHISHQLHPSKLHYLGLAATLRQLCHEFAQQHKLDIECTVRGLPENLEEVVSLNLFRTVQESLSNAVKHGRARHVKMELTCESKVIHLRISDDGIGFDPDDPRREHGLGLVSMQERLRSIGGEFSIWSKPSLGTLVEGTVPLAARPSPSELTVGKPPDAA